MKQKYSRRIAKKVTNKLLIYDCNLPPEPWYRSKYWGKDVSIKRSLSCGRCGGMNNQRLTQTFTIGNCLKRSSEGTVHKCVGVRIRYAIQQENWHLFEMISFICCETQKNIPHLSPCWHEDDTLGGSAIFRGILGLLAPLWWKAIFREIWNISHNNFVISLYSWDSKRSIPFFLLSISCHSWLQHTWIEWR